MAKFSALIGTWFLLLLAPANAATIGLSLPLSGDYSQFAQRFKSGAELALLHSQSEHVLAFQDDGCAEDTARHAAEALIEQNSTVMFGFLCNISAMSAATATRESNIPILIGGAQSTRLIKDREREEWNVWRLSPGDDYPILTAEKAIDRNWQQIPFAIVDDGTIYGRRFSDTLRQLLQEKGLEPQIVDTYRTGLSTQAALLRRLTRSGVSALFIAATDAQDLITILNDSQRLELPFEFMTTEALRMLPYLTDKKQITTTFNIIDWPETSAEALPKTISAEQANRHFLMGYASTQIILQLLESNQNQINQALSDQHFETILGKVSFNKDGSSSFNPFQMLTWTGEQFEPVKPDGTE